MQGNNEGTASHRRPGKAVIQAQFPQPLTETVKSFIPEKLESFMKSKLLNATLLASALFAGLVGLSPVMAQGTHTPGIDNAQQAINARIQQGMASGQITPSEAQALYRRDREIQMRENQYKSNGQATPQERQQLRAELDALGADVERMMSNRDVVGRPGHGGGTPGIDNREFEIGRRIDEGIRSGRLSPREARRLHEREREIARHEAFFKSDGVVTPQERRQLRNELTALRDEVERMMRNDRRGRG